MQNSNKEELWVPFIYSNKYEVNILGQIRNIRTKRLTQANPDKDGYFRVVIWFDNKINNYIVHRIIAEHFLPNPNDYKIINHKDGNKQNNDISNLEWTTVKGNNQHAWDMGLQKGRKGIKHHNCKLTENDVKEIKKLVKEGLTRPVIAKIFGIHKNHIYRILKGLRWSHLT